ncbi:MAG TPA: PPOX class F420-dependent oxidoreductase [Blastocatellia bacterium]|nr:PPOX class F420-dependent oxidoreductase [Blastocatellia bacterium]
MNGKLEQFRDKKYLSVESYRRNGQAVATPVWFVQQDTTFYIYSLADAWKVKRMRNNPRVRIAPCDMRGRITGEWVDASARLCESDEASRGHALLDSKYGFMKRVGNIFSRLMNRERVVIAIEPETGGADS